MTFDLEKMREVAGFMRSYHHYGGERFTEALDEIERLRASLTDLHAEYINTLEKNPECSAWDLDEQSIEDQRRLRRNAAHAISIVEPPIYLQADQQAARIGELEAQLGEIGADATKTIDQTPNSAENMQKTGPDSPKMAVWQITDERRRALSEAMTFLPEEYGGDTARIRNVLRAMLEGAGQ